jgi:hypothetical protein
MRRASVPTAALIAVSLAAPALAGTSRFPAVHLQDGSVVPAHSSAAGEPKDGAAARRRQEIVRSPYRALEERRIVRSGEIQLQFEAGVGNRDALAHGVASTAAALFDTDGWAAPFSRAYPLQLILGRSRGDVPSASGWEQRDRVGLLVRPVIVVAAAEREPDAVLLDVAHQMALLSVRQVAPDESAWAAEAMAEWLALRALGYSASPVLESDPFAAESGTLEAPDAGARFLVESAARLGATAVRIAWEEAGVEPGDDAEAFLRDLGARAHSAGLPGLLAELVSRRVAEAVDGRPATRLPYVSDVALSPPGSLGWRRIAFRTFDERGGVEITAPESASTTRAVLVYRGVSGEYDTLDLAPGQVSELPLAGSALLSFVLADGRDGDSTWHLRRVPDYPAAVVASGAEWRDGAVQVSWRTSSHRDLAAWVLVRYEEDGLDTKELGRELIPTADASTTGFSYQVADRDALPGHRYRYRVLALTASGFLSEAFEAAVVAAR